MNILQKASILRKAYPRFLAVSGVDTSTAITSNAASLKRYASGDAITVTGGTYSLDGGAFTADAGTRGTASRIRLRVTSSASYETLTTVTVTIGGTEYDWLVTTQAEPVSAGFPFTFPFELG